MNHLTVYPLTPRTIYINNDYITIYLPHHINTYIGIRIYYPELYEFIQENEDEQTNYILDRIEWLID